MAPRWFLPAGLAVAVFVALSCGGDGSALPGGDVAAEPAYVVDPSHPEAGDGNPGTADRPLRTIREAAARAAAGDLVLIHPGVYGEQVVVVRGGTAERPVVFQAAEPGTVVVTGASAGFRPSGWLGDHNDAGTSGPGYVTLRGLVFRRTDTYAIRAGVGWRIEDTLLEDVPNAINIRGHEVQVLRTTVRRAGKMALHGSGGRNILIQDVLVEESNTNRADAGIEAVVKFVLTDGMRVENLESRHNFGPGFWLDWRNTNYTVTNSKFHHNQGATQSWQGGGLWTEVNAGPGTITNNVFYANSGCSLGLWESGNIEVRGNTFYDVYCAIELRRLDRGDAVPFANIRIHDNSFATWRRAAIVTGRSAWEGFDPAANNVVIDRNTYRPGPTPTLLVWARREFASLEHVRSALGFEAGGQVE